MTAPACARLVVPPGPEGAEVAAAAWLRACAGEVVELATSPGTAPAGGAGPALVMSTSGSTGEPRRVVLPIGALRASASAGSTRLGEPGTWLSAVPVTGVGGLLTVIRTLTAGSSPVALPSLGGARPFTAELFAAAPDADFVSLVPTQVHRILASRRATRRLADFRAVLVGGARLAPELRARALDAGVRLVATYGATETGGGVVYDGIPLPGVTVRITEETGEISLGGPTIAAGYLDDVNSSRFEHGTFRTGDAGRWVDGRLTVSGRLDDTIKVGGEKVSLAAVTRVLQSDIRVLDAAVVARDSPEWGQVPVAYVVPADDPSPELMAELMDVVTVALGARSRPHTMTLVSELPTTAAGKPLRRG